MPLKKFLWANRNGEEYEKRYVAVIRASMNSVVVGRNDCLHFATMQQALSRAYRGVLY